MDTRKLTDCGLLLLGGLAAGVLTGCTTQAKITGLRTTAERVESDQRLRAINFRTNFQAEGLDGQQLICLVQLFDRNRKAIHSNDGRYESKTGTVSATKTVFAFRSRETFSDVQIAIPAEELGIQADHLPVRGYAGIFDVTGKCLATTSCAVPIRSIEELSPAMAQEPPAAMESPAPLVVNAVPPSEETSPAEAPQAEAPPPPPPPPPVESPKPEPVPTPAIVASQPAVAENAETLWFAKPPRNSKFPVLWGPYASREEARTARGEGQILIEIPIDEQVWFVPVWNPEESGKIAWAGPCLTEAEAGQVMRVLAECVLQGSKLHAGDPIRLGLDEGLKHRVELGDVAHLCDESKKK